MDSLKSRFASGTILRRHTQIPDKLKKQTKDKVTKLEFNIRRRDFDEDYETSLTNDKATIFDTKTKREARKTLNKAGIRDAKTIQENASNIKMRIKRQYKEKIQDIEEADKAARALATMGPRIHDLIEQDEDNTNLENKLYAVDRFAKRNVGYMCAQQLFPVNVQRIPDKIQTMMYEETSENEVPL